jgi:carboxymethylenebutenolidase
VCHVDDRRPPEPPRVTGTATGHELTLTAGDGNQFLAYLAEPEHPTGPRFVLLPDVGGLRPFYRELALDLARAGVTTLALDYYGRTAGVGWRDDTFDEDGSQHAAYLRRELALDDTRAAVKHLGSGATFVVGFCYGGCLALMAGAGDLGLDGVIAFYPFTGAMGLDAALPDEFVADVTCPVLGLFGDADEAVPVEKARAFAEHLSGTRNEIVIYPGETHGFFRPSRESTASADAWGRLLDFAGRA